MEMKDMQPSIETPLISRHSSSVCAKKARKVLLFGSLCYTVSTIVLFTVLIWIILTSSILSQYKIVSRQYIRPVWYTKALADSNIVKQRGCVSATLPDGSVMWIFGESRINTTVVLPSSALIISDLSHAHFISNPRGSVKSVAGAAGNCQIYPGGAVVVNNKLVMHWKVIEGSSCNDGNGPEFSEGENLTNALRASNFFVTERTGSIYIADSIVHEDHVYHFMLRDTKLWLGRIALPKVDLSDLPTEFWDGEKFVRTTFVEAQPIISDVHSPSVSISWNEFLEHFVIVTVSENSIQLRTSRNICGPWSSTVPVYTKEAANIYGSHFHTELWRDDGKVMVLSYDNSVSNLPSFMEVELHHPLSSLRLL